MNVEKAETAFSFTGLPNKLIESLHFKNIKIKSHHGIVGKNALNLFFENAKINENTNYITDSQLTKAVIKKKVLKLPETMKGCFSIPFFIYVKSILTFLLCFNHRFEHIPHFLRNFFEHIEFSGALKPLSTIDGYDFTIYIR